MGEFRGHRKRELFAFTCALALAGLACGPTSDSDANLRDAGRRDARYSSDADICADQVEAVELIHEPGADILLVIDRSLSLSGSRWTTMSAALNDLVSTYQLRARFGLLLFPSNNACATALAAPVADDNAVPIMSALNAAFPVSGGTPTAQALTLALEVYQGMSVNPLGRHVLLATAGSPTCGDASAGANAVAAINALADDGIVTHVLGFTYNASLELLDEMAAAGGGGPYRLAEDLADLKDSLNAVAGAISVPSCEYELVRNPVYDDLIRVFFDNQPVARSLSGIEGWTYNPFSNKIEFTGQACLSLKSGDVAELRVEFGCAGPIID